MVSKTAMISWLVMGLLAAATAGPSTCPGNPPAFSKLKACKVLIVGGGPGGLFSAFLLRAMGRDVCVVERSGPTVGAGRMIDTPGPDPNPNDNEPPAVFGTCGLRINEAQTDLRCLASELNVTLEESNFDTIYYTRGQWTRAMQDQLPNFQLAAAANFSSEDLETELYEYALVASKNVNPLTGVAMDPHPASRCADYPSVHAYLLDTIGQEGTAFLMAGNSFKADWVTALDVCGYIEFFKADWDRCCSNYYPVGGWSAIHTRLKAAAQTAGVRFFQNSEVACLYQVPNPSNKKVKKYVALLDNKQGWSADRMIVNAGPMDIVNIGGNLGNALAKSAEVNSITPIEVAVYNAFYPSSWWTKFSSKAGAAFRVVHDQLCTIRSEFPNHAYVADSHAARPVYADDPRCVAEWKALYAAGGLPAVRERVHAVMQETFPGEDIPMPLTDLFYSRKNSWHYLSPFATGRNVSVDSIEAWALAPMGDPTLCMVGEPYSIRGAGWAHGAWESAVNCLSKSWAGVLPAGVADKIQYYESGCNGAESFPNEVPQPEGDLDGVLPALRMVTGDAEDQPQAAMMSKSTVGDEEVPVVVSSTSSSSQQRFRP